LFRQGVTSETLGLAPAWYIQRNSGFVLKKLKPAEVKVDLKVIAIFVSSFYKRFFYID
jgi:hypothetical protein